MIVKNLPANGEFCANCYLLIDDSGDAAVVDPGCCDRTMLDAITGENVSVKYILLTHGHFDHVLGIHDLKKETGASVCIHSLDSPGLSTEDFSLISFFRLSDNLRKTTPDILLSDGDIINIGGSELKVMHTPGHTPGGVCYICEKDRFILSGDTLFRFSIGRTDFPHSDYGDMNSSLKKLVMLDGDYTVYPGHGDVTSLDIERKQNYFLRELNTD